MRSVPRKISVASGCHWDPSLFCRSHVDQMTFWSESEKKNTRPLNELSYIYVIRLFLYGTFSIKVRACGRSLGKSQWRLLGTFTFSSFSTRRLRSTHEEFCCPIFSYNFLKIYVFTSSFLLKLHFQYTIDKTNNKQ